MFVVCWHQMKIYTYLCRDCIVYEHLNLLFRVLVYNILCIIIHKNITKKKDNNVEDDDERVVEKKKEPTFTDCEF